MQQRTPSFGNARRLGRSIEVLSLATSYRNNYLAALSGTSQGAGRGESLIAVLSFARQWTAAVDWSSYDKAYADFEAGHGSLDPGLAESFGQRLRLPQ